MDVFGRWVDLLSGASASTCWAQVAFLGEAFLPLIEDGWDPATIEPARVPARAVRTLIDDFWRFAGGASTKFSALPEVTHPVMSFMISPAKSLHEHTARLMTTELWSVASAAVSRPLVDDEVTKRMVPFFDAVEELSAELVPVLEGCVRYLAHHSFGPSAQSPGALRDAARDIAAALRGAGDDRGFSNTRS